MNSNNIGAQLYTLRDYLTNKEDIRSTFKKVKEMGYESVQMSGMDQSDAVFLKELTDELGLKICATHTGLDKLKDDINTVIKHHKLWNCEYVGVGSMPWDMERTKENYFKFIKDANEIAKKLADNGLKFIYHNHRYEFQKYDGVCGMDLLAENTDPEIFGFEIDTYWVQAGGANPVQWIKKMGKRLEVIHLKDMMIVDDQQTMAEIGEGNLDWTEIIKACREIGVKWYVVEQDICNRSPFESLDMSLKYLKNNFCK